MCPCPIVENVINNASYKTEEIEFMGSAGTSNFQTANNWIGNAVPGAGETPVIQGGYTVNLTSSLSGTLTGLKVGQTGAGTLNISDATISISSAWPNGLVIGQRAGGNGAVVQSGDSSVTVAGGSGFVSIGVYGTGSYTLQNGTLNATGDFNVGDCRGSHGYFYMQGGTLNLATLYVGNGYYSSTTDAGISGNALGYMNQTNGTVTSTGSLIIGGRNNIYGIGSYEISGGSLIQSNSNNKLSVGYAGTGTLTISGAGLVNSSGGVQISGSANGNGTVHLDGGTIFTPFVEDGGGTATFHFNGGTLKAKNATATFMQGLNTVDVEQGGAIVDTNGFNVTIGQKLLAGSTSGGLTKNGSGLLILTGNPTYTGDTVINAGQLQLNTGSTTLAAISGQGGLIVGGATQLAASSINVGTLTLGINSRVTISPIAGGPTAQSQTTAVPEPSVLLLLLIATMSLGIGYRIKHDRRNR